MRLQRKNQRPAPENVAPPAGDAGSCVQEADDGAELPPGFTTKEGYELYLAVKRDREADPEFWASMDAEIRRAEELGMFKPEFNA